MAIPGRIGAALAQFPSPPDTTTGETGSAISHGNGGNDNGGGNGGQPGNGGEGGDGGGSDDSTTTTSTTAPTTTTSEVGTTTTEAGTTTTTTTPSSTTTPPPVQVQPTATSIVVSPNLSTQGQVVTLTATVTSAGQDLSMGTVTFYMGSTAIGSAQVGTGGTASLSTSSLLVGSDAIDGIYSGFGAYSSSTSATVTEQVEPATSEADSPGLLLFGGEENGQFLSDTWQWTGNSWTLLHPAHSPAPRAGAMLSYDPVSGHDILFGGQGDGGYTADSWEFTGTDWVQLTPAHSPPARAYGALAEEHGGGGPGPDQSSHDAGVGAGHGLLLFGGQSLTGVLADSWIFNGLDWLSVSSPSSPPGRSHSAIAFYPPYQETVLYGGDAGTGAYLGDTWTFQKGTWTQLATTSSPPARAGAVMGQAPANHGDSSEAANGNGQSSQSAKGRGGPPGSENGHVLALYGGVTANGPVEETWSFDGQNWTQASPPGPPGILASTTAAFDETTESLILATGISVSGAAVGDTWSFDGQSWNQVASGATPPGQPGTPTASATNESATVSWAAPATTNGAQVTSYSVTANPSGASMTVAGCPAPTTATFNGLTNATSYRFQVIAISAAGKSQASVPSSPVEPTGAPDPPTEVVAMGENAKAALTWAAPANNGGRPIGTYSVNPSPACPACGGLTVTGSPPDTSAQVTGLTTGVSYTFTVTAQNSLGTSQPSQPSTAAAPTSELGPPGPPRNVSVHDNNGALSVTFDPPASDGGSPITNYVVSAVPAGIASAVTVSPNKRPNRKGHGLRNSRSHGATTTAPASAHLPIRAKTTPSPTVTRHALAHTAQPQQAPLRRKGTALQRPRIAAGLQGPGIATSIAQTPAGVAVAPAGSPNAGTAYLIDASSSVVRAIAPYGTEYVLAGTGQPATSGSPVSGLPATQAQFSQPAGVAVDNSGDVFIADSGFGSLSVVSPSDCASKCPFGLAQMVAGEVYVLAGPGLKTLYMPGSSTPAPDDFNGPQQIAVDPWGNVVVALAIGDEIRVVAAHSCTTSCPYGLATMVAGGMYVIAGDGKAGYSGDGAAATSAKLDFPTGVATDDHGDVFISDHANSVVRMVATSTCSTSCTFGLAATIAGDIYSLAGNGTSGYSGDGGYARAGEMQDPSGLGVDRSGNLYIADPGNYRVRLVAAADCVSDCPAGLSSTTQGDIYSIAGTGQAGYAGDSGPATAAEVYGAAEVALDPSGGLLVSDSSNDRLRFVAGSGCSGSCPYGLALTVAGDIYTVAGTGTASYSGNGGPADMSHLANGLLAHGRPGAKSAAGRSASNGGSAARPRNARKLRGHTAGTPWEIATIARGATSGSQLTYPGDVASDPAGNVIIDDTGSYRIEMMAANNCSANCPYGLSQTVAGYIYTIAGNGVPAFTGDGGPGVDAEIINSGGQGVAVDSHDDVLLADFNNDRVRLIAGFACSWGCPYGLASMQVGFIYTIAGGGNSCFPYGTNGEICGLIYNSQVNNIPALSAYLAGPEGLAVDSAGNYYITVGQTVTMMVAAANCSGNCPLGLSSTTANYMYLVAGAVDSCLFSSPPCTFPPLQSGEPATASPFDGYGVAVDPQGDLAIAYGGLTFLVANGNCHFSCPYGLSSMNRGYLYAIAGNGYPSQGGYNPLQSGMAATSTGVQSMGLATNASGDLLVAGGATVDLVAYRSCSSGCAAGLASTQAGYVYVVAGSLNASGYGVYGYSGDGGLAIAAELGGAEMEVAFDPHGDLLIADGGNFRIRKVFPPVVPTVTSLSPTSGPTTGGTQVVIIGTGFTGASAVAFGAVAASSFAVQSDTEIAAIAPSAQTGVVDVKVSTLGGASPTSASDHFTYVASAPVPTVTSVSPSSGTVAGATQVTIVGTNLTGASAVDFGQIGAVSFHVDSSTQITATTGPSPAGTVDVTVTTPGGQSPTSPSDLFDFIEAPPTVMAISPASGPYFGGTTVTIMGTMLSGASAVHFGPTPATSFQVLSDTEVSATAPAGTGSVDVTVLTGGGFSAASPADHFTYIPAPTLTGIIANMGTTAGGTTIDLHGSALSGTTAVMFGTVPAESFSVVSDTDLVVITPPGTGTVNVTVTTPSGTSLNPNAEFIYVASPTVTSVSPGVGASAGGDVVYVNGTNFYSVSSVAFGTAVVTEGLSSVSPNGFTIVTMSPTKLEVVTPPGDGTVDVTVTNLVATSPVSAADRFTYIPPPTITGFTPGTAPMTGGTQVTITGTGLSTVKSVSILPSPGSGSYPVTSFSAVSDTQVDAVLPSVPGSAQYYAFGVTTLGGTGYSQASIWLAQAVVVAPTTPGSAPTTQVQQLTNGTAYSVTVTATNAYGSSPTANSAGVPQVQPIPAPNATGPSLSMQPVYNPSLRSTTYQGEDEYPTTAGFPRSCGPNGLSVLDAPCTSSPQSGNEQITGRDVDRDCGLSARTASGYDLWVFCDTAMFDKYGPTGNPTLAVQTFTPGSTSAVEPAGEFYPGYAPILEEQTGTNSQNGESNSPFQFLPDNQSPWVNNYEATHNWSPYNACPRWPNGAVAIPQTDSSGNPSFGNVGGAGSGNLVLTFYQEWCYDTWPPTVATAPNAKPGSVTSGGVAWSAVDNAGNPGIAVGPGVIGATGTPGNQNFYADDVFTGTQVVPAGTPGTNGVTDCANTSPADTFGEGALVSAGYLYIYDPVGNDCTTVYLARISLSNTTMCVNQYTSQLDPPWACASNYTYFDGYQLNSSGQVTSTPNFVPASQFFSSPSIGLYGNVAPNIPSIDGGAGGFAVARVTGSNGSPEFVMMSMPNSGNYSGQASFSVSADPWGPFGAPTGASIPGCNPNPDPKQPYTCRAFNIHPELDSGGNLVVSYFQNDAWNDYVNGPSTLGPGVPGRVQFAELPLSCIGGPSCSSNFASPGYMVASATGGLDTFGSDAPLFAGSLGGTTLHKPVVGMANTRGDLGYWLVASDGGVFNFGNAGFYGSAGNLKLNAPIVGIAATGDGKGYWLASSDGGVFAFGDALFGGSLAGLSLSAPVVGISADPNGLGYWLVGSDGGVFSFGNVGFFGSESGGGPSAAIVAMSPTPSGNGYWLAAADGSVYSFGDAHFFRGNPQLGAGDSVTGIAGTGDASGYWEVTREGQVFSFGDALAQGSPASMANPAPPYVAIAR